MHQKSAGFTMVELIIVMIVIAILATLIINNFSGVLPRQRDNERQSETEAISRHLEEEFQRDGEYPTTAVMTGSVSGVRTALGSISPNELAAPNVAAGTNSVIAYVVAVPPTASQYAYWTPNSVACTSSYTVVDCATFVLAYKKEVGGAVVAVCGRGANVNNAKTILAGANGLSGFAAASCSNF